MRGCLLRSTIGILLVFGCSLTISFAVVTRSTEGEPAPIPYAKIDAVVNSARLAARQDQLSAFAAVLDPTRPAWSRWEQAQFEQLRSRWSVSYSQDSGAWSGSGLVSLSVNEQLASGAAQSSPAALSVETAPTAGSFTILLRNVGKAWYLSAPSAAEEGQWSATATTHFTFLYHDWDAPVMPEVTAAAEAAYSQLNPSADLAARSGLITAITVLSRPDELPPFMDPYAQQAGEAGANEPVALSLAQGVIDLVSPANWTENQAPAVTGVIATALARAAINRIAGYACPAWYATGLALYAGDTPARAAAAGAFLVRQQELSPVSSLSSQLASGSPQLARLEALSVIAYLVSIGSPSTPWTILAATAQPGQLVSASSMTPAFSPTLHLTQSQVDARWRAWVAAGT